MASDHLFSELSLGQGWRCSSLQNRGLRHKKISKNTQKGFAALPKSAFAKHSAKWRSALRKFERVFRRALME